MSYECRNPKLTADGGIELEWNHPEHGWIPFHACPYDDLSHGRKIFLMAEAGAFGPVAEYVEDDEAARAEALIVRNQLLSASDWAMLPDAPTDKAAWEDYRQALRDVPEQEGFPTTISWPEKPE